MADEKSIEVIPAMTEAGFSVLQASYIADDVLEADKLLVADIFLAMMDQSSLETQK